MAPTDCLTIDEASELLGLPPQRLHNAIHQKLLPIEKRARVGEGRRERVLVSRADLLAWADAREAKRARTQQAREEKQALQEQKRQARASRDSKPGPGTNAGCQRHSAEWGELLKKTRERLHLTITEVGRRAQTCQSYISRMEGLGEIPRRDKVIAVAKALEADPNMFLLICGYAPEDSTQLAQLLHSLSLLAPVEQMQVMEVTNVYVGCPLPQRQEFLDLVRWWRETPEAERGQWAGTHRSRGARGHTGAASDAVGPGRNLLAV